MMLVDILEVGVFLRREERNGVELGRGAVYTRKECSDRAPVR